MKRDVVVSGIGLVSVLGEELQDYTALFDGLPQKSLTEALGPFLIHPLCNLSFEKQIPRKGDQRQMEVWQRIGVYTAGLALLNSNLAGQAELLSKTHMIIAADGGERDETVDNALMSGIRFASDRGAYLNERLMGSLRPTLFLAQLTNLLAGNISIIHGVTGSSRSFMGEEAAGVSAIRTLYARIASGQVELGLVGAANNAARKDLALNYAFGGALFKPPYLPVWSRGQTHAGVIPGSMGAFLVLEEREHALARGAKIFARITYAASDRCARLPGEAKKNLEQLYKGLKPQLKGEQLAVLSCASGVAPITQEEEEFWHSRQKEVVLRAIGSLIGHGPCAQAPFACALAALALDANRFFVPFEEKERALSSAQQIIISSAGHWRGEGMLLLEQESDHA
jgi:3-oxoacyl-[acyl-carrier-protein] synthase II